MNAAVAIKPMTAEEFFAKHEHDHVELIDGVVKEEPMPSGEHGFVSGKLAHALMNVVYGNNLGRVLINDSFILLKRNPDLIHGPDLAYYSYAVIPPGPMPKGLLTQIPELVVETRSESDRWKAILRKVDSYLTAGVKVVVVLDPDAYAASLFRKGELQQVFDNGDELTIPDLFPGFAVPVRAMFE